MLNRLNAQLQDVSVSDWKLAISLLIVTNVVAMTSLAWLVLTRTASAPPSLEARVMAQVPPTRTPLPTFTSTHTPTSTPSPTNTPVPTWTPTSTSTPPATAEPPLRGPEPLPRQRLPQRPTWILRSASAS